VQDNCQKIKLLKLLELLRQETDELHPMATAEICCRLEDMGISCDRRTLARDIALLNQQGFEVMTCQMGKGKGYYVEDRSFSVAELKILIDAVQAASFITDGKTQEMIEKIAGLGGSHQSEILRGNMVCFNTRKHSNEAIYYNVGDLEDAILQQKKIIFRYFDRDEQGNKVYRRNGHRYVVEPVAMVFNEDNYYLIAYSSRFESTANYRVDRMDSVQMLEETVTPKALELRQQVGSFTEQAIKMYGGQIIDVALEFHRSLIGAVYDRFGENIHIIPWAKEQCRATVKVQISPTFWGWIFQFGKLMRILSPQKVKEQYKNQIADAWEAMQK